MPNLKKHLTIVAKGMAMGAANVIPGVSGGTIALITGIYEKLINSLKSFDLAAVKYLFKGKFKDFAKHVNLDFLIAIFLGIGVSIISLAKILEYLFENYPVLLWAFFFGLILASVVFVGKTIYKWNLGCIITLLIGTAAAAAISLLNPASEYTIETAGWLYLFICGIVAISSMILPGLSGSFVLILMGAYKLIMITSITHIYFSVFIPVGLGCIFGLLAFSHLLAWVFKKYRDLTIALLTGFILGSLMILWPWKETIFLTLEDGEKAVKGYHWFLPGMNMETALAVGLMVIGFLSIWGIEKFAAKQSG